MVIKMGSDDTKKKRGKGKKDNNRNKNELENYHLLRNFFIISIILFITGIILILLYFHIIIRI